MGAGKSFSGFKEASHVVTTAIATTIPRVSASPSDFGAMSVSWRQIDVAGVRL
jgi:hypothetical protein